MCKGMRLGQILMTFLMCGFFVVAFGTPAAVAQVPPTGPVSDLEQRIAELEALSQPLNLTVNCADGETVADALAQAASTIGRVTITIVGVCTESVTITRNDVTLQGASPGDGLQAPSLGSTILRLIGGHITRLNQLTLTGGGVGLQALGGAFFSASDLHITGASNAGIVVVTNASGTLRNSTVENCRRGIDAREGGSLIVDASLIDKSTSFGVHLEPGGTVTLVNGTVVRGSGGFGAFVNGGSLEIIGATVEGSVQDGVVVESSGSALIKSGSLIQNNGGFGLVAHNSGAIRLSDGARVANNLGSGILGFNGGGVFISNGAIVEFNTGAGVELSGGSSARIDNGSIIQGNNLDGVHLSDTSVATFQDAQVINNGGVGIACDLPPAVAQIHLFNTTVSGNGNDTIACPIN